jgi:hypothetical protein
MRRRSIVAACAFAPVACKGGSAGKSAVDRLGDDLDAFAAVAGGSGDCATVGKQLQDWLAANRERTSQDHEAFDEEARSTKDRQALIDRARARGQSADAALGKLDLRCRTDAAVQAGIDAIVQITPLGFYLPAQECRAEGDACRMPSGKPGGRCVVDPNGGAGALLYYK